MPKFSRENLRIATQRALDSLEEFYHLEKDDLTRDEEVRLQTQRAYLCSAHDGIQRLLDHIEERRTTGIQPIPRAPEPQGELFSWERHDDQAIRRRLEAQLERMQKELAELEDANPTD